MSRPEIQPSVSEEMQEMDEFMDQEPVDQESAEQDALMEEYLSNLRSVHKGELRTATVVAIVNDSVLVSLGDKSEGLAPLSEFRDSKGTLSVQVGDQIPVQVVSRDSDTGQIQVSHKVARGQAAMLHLTEAQKSGAPMKGTITKAVKSGVIVDCGMECFMPASHIDTHRVENLESWIGQEVEFIVLEVTQGTVAPPKTGGSRDRGDRGPKGRGRRDRDRDDEGKGEPRAKAGRAVVSRRQWLENERERKLHDAISKLKVGDVVEGNVKAVLGFGAFVDLGGVEAIIPREEVSWEKAASPVDHLRPGNHVQAKIIRLNAESGKITLSRKQMTQNPWEIAAQRYPKGTVVSGEVTGLTKFGAFVRLEEGLTGLIHATDMSWSTQSVRPEELLKEGDNVQAAVVELDVERQRLSLGLKQITEDPWVEAEKRYPMNSKIKGTVTGLTKFGAFVRLEDNIEGLIHQQDFTWDKNAPAPQDFLKVGDEVEAVVLKTDRSTRRISLGLKQLTPSPLQSFGSRYKNGQAIDGKVVNIIDTGAFLELEPNVDGFLPTSQISEQKIKSAADVLKVGETIRVKITKLDIRGNRISLSRKAFVEEEERASVANYLKTEESRGGGTNLGDLLRNINLPEQK